MAEKLAFLTFMQFKKNADFSQIFTSKIGKISEISASYL
jgi:hypothetical protein